MFSAKLRALCALLAASVLLSGCTLTERLSSSDTASGTTAKTVNGLPYFGIAYNPGESVNPITSTSKINRPAIEAMYEGLFALDNTFTPQPVLCASYTSSSTSYTLHLRTGVTFWSGQPLRASDVAYCYRLAQDTAASPYHDRMQQVSSISTPDDSTIQITLKSPNSQFLKLLDIPVFRQGTSDSTFPDGTGPYLPQSNASLRWLTTNNKWHGGTKRVYSRIDLISTTRPDAVIYSFETGDISLAYADRISATPATVKGTVETYKVPSANLQYLGVNYKHKPYQLAAVRQAISLTIDRDSLCATQLQSFADPAVLPVNPQPTQSSALSYQTDANTESALALLNKAGIKDSDGDGVLDYPDEDGHREPLSPVILVNSENTFKVAAAKQIASYLQAIGIQASVHSVSFDDYQSALANGDFDLYYAETQMTPDFDLRPLLYEDGVLNYGKCADDTIHSDIQQLRAASGTAAVSAAQQTLYTQLLNTMPIIPVAFLRSQIVLRSGLLKEYVAAPYTSFYHIQDWKQS